MSTIYAASLSPSDVQAAMDLAGPGDTVQLPAGTAYWTEGCSWSAPAGVQLAAAGTSDLGGGDVTTIYDNIASSESLLQISLSSSGFFRMTGITFRSGTGTIKDGGTIRFNGGTTACYLRIDHCHFVPTSTANYKIVVIGQGVFGVMDSCILDLTGTNALYFYNGRSTGLASDQAGNLEWSLPTNFGTDEFFYIEDCVVNGSTTWTVYDTRLLDGFTSARAVVRFNTLRQCVVFEQHATGHSGDDRGPRATEAYCNLVTSELAADPNFLAVDMQNGCALVWGNSWNNVFKNIYRFNLTRKDNGTYYQPPTPDGWGYAGTNSGLPGAGSNWDGGTFNGTDTTLGYPAIDQPGRGHGDLLVGLFPNKLNDSTGIIEWPNQALEPIYIWNNTGNIVPGWGGNYVSNAGGGRIVENRDYYLPASDIQSSPTSPFDGTSGTGWGTLANRPTTCTPGVAYFAIDQGSWNQSASNPYGVNLGGLSGVLYKCTSTNTWTEYYEPYTYPHPLRDGGLGEQYVEDPEFSPAAGSYVGNQVVTITTPTSGATIRYTLDGSTPTSSTGFIYSSPIGVAVDTTIKAMAYKSGLLDSLVVSAEYTITPSGPGPGVSGGALTANRINLA